MLLSPFYCRRSVYEKFGTFDLSYKVAADFENLLRLIFIHHIRTRYIDVYKRQVLIP